jgi:hypothetical protein
MVSHVLEGGSRHLRTVLEINSLKSKLFRGDRAVTVGHEYSDELANEPASQCPARSPPLTGNSIPSAAESSFREQTVT